MIAEAESGAVALIAPESVHAEARLASYLGHFKPAACHRLVAGIWHEHPWLNQYFRLDRDKLSVQPRYVPPVVAPNVLAQYRHWRTEFPEDEVLIQIGAFVERLQWPPRRVGRRGAAPGRPARPGDSLPGLRRMRATRRGAIDGFPIRQLPRRVAALLAQGRSVLLVVQTDGAAGRIVQRQPFARWGCGTSDRAARARWHRCARPRQQGDKRDSTGSGELERRAAFGDSE